MGRRFTEADIVPSLHGFARDCAAQFAELGLVSSEISGGFELRLTNDLILTKAEQRLWHGRVRYKGQERSRALWAFSDDPGVYLFFDGEEKACYVGKAEVALGSRIGAHIGARGDDHMYAASAFPEAEYVVVVPFIQ